MSQKSKIVECELLHEFVDDACARPQNGPPPAALNGPETLRRMVARIAGEVGLRDVNFEPVLNQLAADMGPEIEERVRKVLLQMADERRKAGEDSSAA